MERDTDLFAKPYPFLNPTLSTLQIQGLLSGQVPGQSSKPQPPATGNHVGGAWSLRIGFKGSVGSSKEVFGRIAGIGFANKPGVVGLKA